ncbi:MAG: sugar phosphate isomerase/epimerase [Gemmataceae bacterium]|nr:sugar phosphate isomerase/epimerase [Gemmataceae bacterium]
MSRLTRREWLAAVPLLTGTAVAANPARIPLGFSLYGMKTMKLADALSACSKIGYDGVELALMPGYPAEPKLLSANARKDLRTRLADHKLALHGLMENLPEPAADPVHKANLDRLKAAFELGHALADGKPVVETILGGKPAEWESRKEAIAERMRSWAAVAKASNGILAIKLHVGNALHTIDGAQWLVKQVASPHFRLGFDFSHLVLRGVKLAEAIENLVPQAAFVHIKDAKGTPEKFEFLLPGEHGIDYAEYVKRLSAAQYAGPVVVEVSGMISNKPGYDPVAAAAKSYANLANAFGRPAK